MSTTTAAPWRKASYSGNSGNCVEVAPLDGVSVRDSKDVDRGRLAVAPASWKALTASIKG